jgi:hypothetical protein
LPAGASDPVVDVGNNTLVKLNAADGTVVWSLSVANDGALAVDPIDLSVYTGLGSHSFGGDGSVYKFDSAGNPLWSNSISMNSTCNFDFVTNAAVDGSSSSPGVVWTENRCFGAIAKSDRATGAQQWSVVTYDLGRPSIDPANGQIYVISNAGNQYDAETIYSEAATGGAPSFAASCEGFTDLNPADGQLYRGGGDPGARGCGTVLYQLSKSSLGAANWSMDLSSYIVSFDAIAVQPWQGGYIYVASIASSKILVVDPATQTVVTSFNSAIVPRYIAVDPNGGNLYVADGQTPPGFVLAYSPTGALLWINPNLGGPVTNLATARAVVGVPPVPVAAASTSGATNVTDTSATLNGTVNPNGSSTTVYFQYGTTTAYGSQTPNQTFTGSTSQNVSANVSGLSSGTTYHYRIVAMNGGGTIVGNDVTFSTAVPTPTPTCPAPTIRISSDRNSIHKGETATISLGLGGRSTPPCNPITVFYTVSTHAVQGTDYVITDSTGQVITNNQATGDLFLHNLYTSRTKTLPISFTLRKNSAYYMGNKKVTVELLAQ